MLRRSKFDVGTSLDTPTENADKRTQLTQETNARDELEEDVHGVAGKTLKIMLAQTTKTLHIETTGDPRADRNLANLGQKAGRGRAEFLGPQESRCAVRRWAGHLPLRRVAHCQGEDGGMYFATNRTQAFQVTEKISNPTTQD